MKKHRFQKGEMLIESLAGILIFTLASIAIYSMLSAASDLNRKSRVLNAALKDQLNYVEKANDPDAPTTEVSFTLSNGQHLLNETVQYYVADLDTEGGIEISESGEPIYSFSKVGG